MEDLQQAYSAYQQALYHLRDPKAREVTSVSQTYWLTPFRSLSFGMVLGYCMIAMAHWNMRKKPFRR